MATSSNPAIQSLMNQVDAIDPNSPDIEATLQKLAEAVALENQKLRGGNASTVNDRGMVDPQDAFICDGCE